MISVKIETICIFLFLVILAFLPGCKSSTENTTLSYVPLFGRLFANQRKVENGKNDTVKVSHILISPKNSSEQAHRDAKIKVEKLISRIKNGESFEMLAEKYSDCPSSKNYGVLGDVKRGMMVPDFEKAAFSLKPGVIKYVETPYGYHIIKLTDEHRQFLARNADNSLQLKNKKVAQKSAWELWKDGYNSYKKSEQAVNEGKDIEAKKGFERALSFFEDIRLLKPDWNQSIIEQRIAMCKKQIAILSRLNYNSPPQDTKNNILEHKKNLKSINNVDNITASENYYSLIIGNNKYAEMPALKSALDDAKAVAELLKIQYNFNTTLLLNAEEKDITHALRQYRKKLTQNDSLLIYYAGHGWLDKEGDLGYWLPVDAEKDNEANWVSNAYIASAVRAIQAKHILIVADSCFAGKLTRGLKLQPATHGYLNRIAAKKSRTVMTSGGVEPVMDSGGKGNHSVFASAFMDVLKENKGAIDANSLFVQIRRKVMLNSDQTPEYSDIRKAGHDGGDFIFVRRKIVQ